MTARVLTTSRPRVKLRIQLDCTPAIYFDTLKHVLLTNDASDFGSSEGNHQFIINLLSPKWVYVKDLKRSSDNFYYVDSV